MGFHHKDAMYLEEGGLYWPPPVEANYLIIWCDERLMPCDGVNVSHMYVDPCIAVE